MNNRKFTNLLSLFMAILATFSVSTMTAQVVTCTTTGVPVTINTGADIFNTEVGWELYNVNLGEVVAYESTGGALGENQSITFNAPAGDYELYGYDFFGDNWQGFDIEIVSGGQTVCFGDDVAGPGNTFFGGNAGVSCGGNNNSGTLLCDAFLLGTSDCTVDCPADIIAENDPGQCGAFVNIPAPTLGAECVDVTNDFNGTSDPSGFYPVGTTEVTVSGFDQDGFPDMCTFTVTVNDTEGPTFASCSNDITINLDAGECDYIFNFDIEDVTDNCPPSAGACTQASDTVTVDDAFACFIDEFSYMQIFPKDVCGGSPTGDVNLEFARTGITWLSAPQDVSVNIYGYNQADPFEMANLDLVFTQVETFPLSPFPALGGPSDKYTVNFASPAVVDGSYDSYVVEMVCPAVGFGNFPFTLNDGGALSDTYWRALNGPNGCGDFEPEEIGAASGGILQGTDWLLVIGASSSFNVTNCGDVEDGDFLEEGVYNVCYEAEDGAGNVGRCEYTLTVQNFPNPSQSLACNDHVNVSVDNSCEAIINADMILEGGPYSCYRDYIVQLATDMQFNNIIAESQPGDEGVFVGGAQVGNTYFVRVIDPETGNSCCGEVTNEDKLIPALECGTYAAACEASTDPDATITVEPAFLTASEDTMEIEQFQAIACPGGDYSYLRVIDLAAQGITGEFTPQLFRMGVETSTGGVDATLRFYRFTDPSVYDPNADGFSLGDLEQLGADNNGTIPALDLEFWELPVADVTVPGGTQYLVWELEVPGGNFADFVMGSNTLGETSPTYLASEFCGNVDPLTLSSLGFDGNWVS